MKIVWYLQNPISQISVQLKNEMNVHSYNLKATLRGICHQSGSMVEGWKVHRSNA